MEHTLERVHASDLNIFQSPARLFVTGFSSSGKSCLIGRVITKYINEFDEIIISGSNNFPVTPHPKIKYHKGDEAYNPLSRSNASTRMLVVYDDFMMDSTSLKIIATVFCKGRHMGITSIYLNQSLFHSNPYHRSISLNSTHFIILRMRDVNQIRYFAKTFLHKSKVETFVLVYKTYVERKQYGHLLVDFSKNSDSKLLLRSNISGPGYEKAIVL